MWVHQRVVGLRKAGWAQEGWLVGGTYKSRARLPDLQEAGRGTDLDQLSETRLKWRPDWSLGELLRPESI